MDMTVQQAAKRLKVTPARVWQLIDAGRIKARYLSPRVVLIDEKELAKPTVKNRKPGRPWAKKRGR
jgi:excisionase family DNA binding protein